MIKYVNVKIIKPDGTLSKREWTYYTTRALSVGDTVKVPVKNFDHEAIESAIITRVSTTPPPIILTAHTYGLRIKRIIS